MFVWLKMHKNASPVLEISFAAFILFYFFLNVNISKTKLAYGERI